PLAPRTTTFSIFRDSARARRAFPALSAPSALWLTNMRTPFCSATRPRRSGRSRWPAPRAITDLRRSGANPGLERVVRHTGPRGDVHFTRSLPTVCRNVRRIPQLLQCGLIRAWARLRLDGRAHDRSPEGPRALGE